jgi:hypothetical protein
MDYQNVLELEKDRIFQGWCEWSRSETPYKPVSHDKNEQSTHGESQGDTASKQQMALESSHGDTASAQRIVRESSHGDTVSAQGIVRILVLTSDRTCGVAVKGWGNCIVRCYWGTGFKSSLGYEPEELDVVEQTYLLSYTWNSDEVFCIYYCFNYCNVVSINIVIC